ncbi:MAG: sigma-70 family RNA polymerase sigma factor [Gemmataceae bacterium]|nr:sigma-70 family RNA polymerase sigma factor [Gemmataceae bacterium]
MRHLEPLQASLEAYCRRSLNHGDAIADVLQSAVANAFRDFDRYAEGTDFRAWMFRYVHLEILNTNRKSARLGHAERPPEVAVEDIWQLALTEPLAKVLLDDPEPILDQCDAAVSEAVRELPALERSVLLLRTIGEFKYRETAEILQIPIGTVMSALARGRSRLRERLLSYAEKQGLLRS